MSAREEELINQAARIIVDSGWDTAAIFYLNALKPVTFIGGELSEFFLAPYLILLEDKGFELIEIFEKRENVEKLIKKVEELSQQKHAEGRDKEDDTINVIEELKKLFKKNKS